MSAARGTPRVPPIGVAAPSGTVPVATDFIIPRTAHLPATSPLPLYPTFTSQAFFELPLGTSQITFWISYTGASDAGRPAFQVEDANDSPGGEVARTIVIDSASGLDLTNAPDGLFDVYLAQVRGPAPGNGEEILYRLDATCRRTSRRIRLLMSEIGDLVNPGDGEIFLTGAS